MIVPAQTNLALYKQLHRLGYDEAALVAMRDGYEFATTLFAGQCRATGKPFLAHLVGTASGLAAVGAAPATVAAGLLHAAYEQGDFGPMRWRERRRRLRHAIGEAAEALVWRYQTLPWSAATVPRLHDTLAALPAIDRTVVLMRLANELDDNLDVAMPQCDPARDAHRGQHEILVAMAQELNQPALAEALNAAYREAGEAAWAAALSLNRGQSYRPAPTVGQVVRRALRSWLGR